MRRLLAALTLVCAPLLMCATPAAAQETTLFPYRFNCPAEWSAAGQQAADTPDGLTWCVAPPRNRFDLTFIGELRLFPYPSLGCPRGWLKADGTQLRTNYSAALFALLGDRFGGDGEQTFALPAMTDTPDGMTWCIAVEGRFPPRS